MNVPVFRLKFDKAFRDEFYAECEKIFDKAFLTNDEYVARFEKDFAAFNHSKFALATSNGTTAIECALRCIGVKDREVIVPTNTFIATAVAALDAGAAVKVVDIENRAFSISADALEKAITEKTKVVIIVHVGGIITPDIIRIRDICAQRSVVLVEDCAHAHGSTFNGVSAGNFGRFGCFSFFPTKVVTCGEGGMVVANDPVDYERLMSIRQFGRVKDHSLTHDISGANFKQNEFCALLGVLDLKRAEKRISRREAISDAYRDGLQGTPWQVIQGTKDESSRCAYYKQIITHTFDQDSVKAYFEENQVALTGAVYEFPLHEQPVLRKQNVSFDAQYPVSDQFSAHHICPPCFPELEDAEVARILEVMKGFKG